MDHITLSNCCCVSVSYCDMKKKSVVIEILKVIYVWRPMIGCRAGPNAAKISHWVILQWSELGVGWGNIITNSITATLLIVNWQALLPS